MFIVFDVFHDTHSFGHHFNSRLSYKITPSLLSSILIILVLNLLADIRLRFPRRELQKKNCE